MNHNLEHFIIQVTYTIRSMVAYQYILQAYKDGKLLQASTKFLFHFW
jgi:hypothetical protein